MFKYLVIMLIMGMLLGAESVLAQDDLITDEDNGILEITVGELVGIVVALSALLLSAGNTLYQWAKQPPDQRSLQSLDDKLAGTLKEIIGVMMPDLENLADTIGQNQRVLALETAEIVLKAAMWTPSKTDDVIAASAVEVLGKSQSDVPF